MPSNSAAWLVAEKAHPLEIQTAPYNIPGDKGVIVKNAALAINPVDWALQASAIFPLKYPAIPGADIAGEVLEVGNGVTGFKKGDRVLAFALGSVNQTQSQGAFQEYTVMQQQLGSVIPDSLSFERAAVCHCLQHPSVDCAPNGKTLLIWGGSSSVGSNAIQLAIASGYEAATTASCKNFELLGFLMQSINHNNGAIEKCVEAASRLRGNKFIATVRQPPEDLPSGVGAKVIFSSDIKDNEVDKVIFESYLPKALAEGKFVAAPDPYVVSKGLEFLQAGIDVVNGMSAKKAVINL
ncbi:MAG: hypothetical protein L6R42_010112 [Xanthoria sp. 1 TBL-2021]|nr:MAG: hypothetical protein L6R42_010112 [Xanthoria sp. 1 TBL-2021]